MVNRYSNRYGNNYTDDYTSGIDVLRLLASADGAVRAQLSEQQAELERIEQTARDDVSHRGDQLIKLAHHYLPDMTKESVEGVFHEVRRDLKNVLARKQQRETDLQKQWDRALDQRQKLQNDLDAVTVELDTLVDSRETLEQKLAEVLEQDESFQDLSRHALRTEQELERNQDRVEESKQEAAEKLPAYKSSKLFQYLVKRGYGTPDYKKRGLTRRLDRWVAKLVDFDKSKKSYDFLQVTPELMAAEVDRRRSEFDKLMDQVEEVEQRYSNEIGLTDVLKQGMKEGKRRDALVTKIDAEQLEQESLERELRQLSGRDNEFYDQATERMRQFLGGLKESALEAKTRGTVSTADDVIFSEIQWLNDRLDEARRDAEALRRSLGDLGRRRNDLLDLGRRFRTAEFDSQRSVFPAGYDPRPDIERLVRGDRSKEAVWDDIKRHQRFLPTWVERRQPDRHDLLDGEFSYLMLRVLAEVAGAAFRHAANNSSRGGSHRRIGLPPSVSRRAGGGFTRGRGF